MQSRSALALAKAQAADSKDSETKLESMSKQLRERLDESEAALNKEKSAKRALQDELEDKQATIQDLR